MKSDKFRIQSLPPFPGTLDPQRTLQRLREHTADGCEAEHKKGWVILNREALVKTFVTDRYRPAHQSSSACVKVKEQITAMTEMYYDFVVCVKPVPEDLNKDALTVLSFLPTRLVVKLGMLAAVRSDPGSGGREKALGRQRAKKAAKNSRTGGKKQQKRSRLKPAADGVNDEDHHRLHGTTNSDGTAARKRGRKTNSKVSADGTVIAPSGSLKPVANKAVAASSSGAVSSSSAAACATAAFESHRVAELERNVEELTAEKLALKSSIRDLYVAAAKKDLEYQAELRNRSNIALMSATSSEAANPDVVSGYMTSISPFKMAATDDNEVAPL